MPITWRNVGDRGYGDAALLMRGASNNFNKGFDILNGLVDQQQNVQEGNFVVQRDNNTNAAKDLLASYLTPEALKAAQDSGELQSRLAALGPNIDRSVVRTGAADRLGALQTEFLKNEEFGDKQAMVKAQPVIDQYNTLLLTDPAAANAYLNDPANRALVEAAHMNDDLAKTADARGQELLDRSREAQAHGWQSMQHQWKQTDHARQEQEYLAGKSLEKTLLEHLTTGREQAAATSTASKQELQDLGLPQNQETGDVAIEQLTPEERSKYEGWLQKQVAGPNQAANFRDQITAAVRNNPNASLAQIDTFKKLLAEDYAARNSIDPITAQQLAAEDGRQAAALHMDTNPHYVERKATLADYNAVIDAKMKSSEGFNRAMLDSTMGPAMQDKIQEITQQGIELPDAPGQYVKITPNQLSSLLNTVQDADWLGNGGDTTLQDVLAEFVQNPGFIQNAKDYVKYDAESRQRLAAAQPDSDAGRAAINLAKLRALAVNRKPTTKIKAKPEPKPKGTVRDYRSPDRFKGLTRDYR